jgi:hypothetical protein
MAAVATIFIWRPRPGRLQDLMAAAAAGKKVHERLGGQVRAWNSQFGGEPMTLGYVIEHADWKKFGEFTAKLESDREWQTLMAGWTSQREPIADLLGSQVVVETPLG